MSEPISFRATLGPTRRYDLANCYAILIPDTEGVARHLKLRAGATVTVTITEDNTILPDIEMRTKGIKLSDLMRGGGE